jgi:hypothetical protein
MMSGQEDITLAVKRTLERTGTLDTVRSLLRADIHCCLTDCLKKEEEKLSAPQENILINEIVADYLAFNGYFNTLSVLATETGTPSLLDSSSHVTSSNSGSLMKLGPEFIRAELGLSKGTSISPGRRRSPTLAMMYEIVETLKARNWLRVKTCASFNLAKHS